MNKGINLATNKRATRGALFNQLRVLRLVAVGILGVIAVSSMVLFFLIAASPLPDLKKQENNQLFQITQLHPKIAKFLLVNERVNSINKLMTLRESKSMDLEKLEAQIPHEANIDSLSVNDKGIIVSISSDSLGSINTFISNLLSNTGSTKSFSSILLNTLAFDSKSQIYRISVVITL